MTNLGFLRIQVELDVRKSLFRRKRLNLLPGWPTYVLFKYERLPTYCYLCGRMGHLGSFYKLQVHTIAGALKAEWDESIKVSTHRNSQPANHWLRDDRVGTLQNSTS